MARNPKQIKKKKLEQYEHKGKRRLNNPPVGLVNLQMDQDAPKKKYKIFISGVQKELKEEHQMIKYPI